MGAGWKGAGAAAPPPSLPLPGAPVPAPGRGGISSTFTSPVLTSPSMCKSPSSSRPAGLASGPVAAAMARRASMCAGLGCGELTTSESPWFSRPCGEWGKGIESRFDSGKKEAAPLLSHRASAAARSLQSQFASKALRILPQFGDSEWCARGAFCEDGRPRISHEAYKVNLQVRGSGSFQCSEILSGARAALPVKMADLEFRTKPARSICR